MAFVGDPPGTLKPYAGSSSPEGYLLADGTSYATATYPALFAAIGYAYGGSAANFNVPNLKGKVPVGRDAAQAEFDVLGETGGSKTHTLTITEMPAHDHPANSQAGAAVNGPGGGAYTSSGTTGSTGGGAAHNNLQPYVTFNYIVKT